MQAYYGKNTKTEYAKTRIITAICYCIYSLLGLVIMLPLTYWCINCIYKYYIGEDTIPIVFSYILVLIFLFLVGLLIASIVVNIVLCSKNGSVISYYKHNPLINVHEIIIEYDSKLWLTAPKDTFHPMSFFVNIDDVRMHFKSSIVFTNSSKYFVFPKFKMPEVLMSKNYIKGYGVVGYDANKDEYVIIGFRNRNE